MKKKKNSEKKDGEKTKQTETKVEVKVFQHLPPPPVHPIEGSYSQVGSNQHISRKCHMCYVLLQQETSNFGKYLELAGAGPKTSALVK